LKGMKNRAKETYTGEQHEITMAFYP